MRKLFLAFGLLAATVGMSTTGCVVRETRVARHGCAGGIWIEGHYGPHGRWHPGHWRCPGVYERIEID
jgi:hypothetical protein